jgi:iron complex outermembrane receptor protein
VPNPFGYGDWQDKSQKGIMSRSGRTLAAVCAGVLAVAASPAAAVSEQDYFTEMPEVLSVSRLAQPLDETPGAVTVIDREMIRRSGARTVVELLRLVPGYITANFEGGARPIASYHSDYHEILSHLQVFVDGRSVYSTLLLGSASYGMMGVVLEDVERIEVLRGSNSAAYGADAFLGVVNIVTRHSADTRGGMVAVSVGEGGLRDGVARVGWGGERASFRLTAARRGDDGFANFYDSSRTGQAHFRGDLQPTPTDDLTLTAGHTDFRWGAEMQDVLLPRHDESWRDSYGRVQWTHRLNATDELALGITADEERYLNFFPFLRADGTSRRTEIEAQHSFVAAPGWRMVWGTQYRYEHLISADLFSNQPDQSSGLWRVFGNIEVIPHPAWVVNAGAMFEKHSISGSSTAPRLMVNYHLLPDHTVRVGATTAYKQPTLYDLRADWQYVDWLNGVHRETLASGQARPERVNASEIGYLGRLREWGLTADVRIFHEKVIDELAYQHPTGSTRNDLVNKDPSVQKGWEMQLRWQPVAATQILLNHMQLRMMPDATSTSPRDAYRAPKHVSTLAWFQRLPADFDLTVIYTETAAYYYVRQEDMIPAFHQADVRLARRFTIGSTRAEAALTVRAVDGRHVDYVKRHLLPMVLDRRAFATLRLEF